MIAKGKIFLVCFVCSILLTAYGLSGCRPSIDISVGNIEVTQGIQTSTNTITLVAQRSTAVRVTVNHKAITLPTVDGRLHIFVNGTEITPTGGLLPINTPFQPPTTAQRGNENDTLNFEILAPTNITASTNVDFRVDLTSSIYDPNTTNNTEWLNDLTFAGRLTPLLYYVRVDYTPAGQGLPDVNLVQAGSGDLFVHGILPVNDGDTNLYRESTPTMTFATDPNNNNVVDGTEVNTLLTNLATRRQTIVNNNVGATSRTFLYGWLRGNPIDGNGWATVNGFNAFGNTEAVRGQRTYAHELLHNFGLSHNNNTLNPEVGWDVGGRLDGDWAGNNVTGRVKPANLFDLMVAGQLTNVAWVCPGTYQTMLNHATLALPPPSPLLLEMIDLQPHVLVVYGYLDPDGKEILWLSPAFRFPWLSQPTPAEQKGRFLAEAVDEAGKTYAVGFDALITDDTGRTMYGFFEVMLPVSPDLKVDSLRILDAENQIEFIKLTRTEPPQIEIITPATGDHLGEKTTLSWQVKDPDTPLDQLATVVVYSPDRGENWSPIAVGLTGEVQQLTFDSTQIRLSDQQGVLRIFVSDGLNTVYYDVGGLTTDASTLK